MVLSSSSYRTMNALVVVVCLLLYYINKPPPKFSSRVQEWFNSSQVFSYNNTFDIHFHDIVRDTTTGGSTLLVIHGFPASSFIWQELIPKFQNKFNRVIIPDLLGLGFSDKPVGYKYSLMEHALILEELCLRLGVRDVHLLAHDYGVSIAQEFIHKFNMKESRVNIESVCFTNGGLVPSHHDLLFIQKLFSSPTFKKVMPHLLNYPIYKNRLSSIFGAQTQPSDQFLQDVWAIMLYKNGHVAIPDIFTYIFERRANEERWVVALQETNVPLVLIYGPLDPVNTPQGFLKSFRKLVPNSKVNVLGNIGHYPQVEDPERFYVAYEEFLEGIGLVEL